MSDFITAREAAQLLGIKLSTLYAYASRGMVRTLAPKPRTKLYAMADLVRLKARHDARAGHGAVAAGAMHWGDAVLDTAVSTFDPRGPIYRGRLATDLCPLGFEPVAELLWTAELPPSPTRWVIAPSSLDGLCDDAPKPMSHLRRMLVAIARCPLGYEPSWEPEVLLPSARAIIAGLSVVPALGLGEAALRSAAAEGSIARRLIRALGGVPRPESERAIDQALVLSADHELNPSSFAARIAASTGADLGACVTAALATLSGSRHGGLSDQVESLVREVGSAERAADFIHNLTLRGATAPGFGHPMYPNGDPRAAALLKLAESLSPKAQSVQIAVAMVRAAREQGLEPPSLDLGLVALANSLGLSPGAAGAIFAVARAAGWVAHATEQHSSGAILRPRARYVGLCPPACAR